MFTVYLLVDFLLLFVDNMQTLLNTHTSAPYPLWQRIILKAGSKLSAGLMLLLLVGFANQVLATPGFSSNSVVIASTPGTGGSGNVNGTYYTNTAGSPKFTTITNLGTFDRGTGSLTLGATSNTTESGNENVTAVRVFYRVYSTAPGTVVPAFTVTSPSIPLQQLGGASKNRQWNSLSPVNLLNATTGPDTYKVDFFFQLTYSDNKNTGVLLTDIIYSSTFVVRGNAPAVWQGKTPFWSDGGNWSTGKEPDFNTDVTVPLTNNTVFPVISADAQVRTLTIQGNNANDKATVTLDGGELQIFGDFRDPNAGFTQNSGVFTLAGTNQTFDGGRFFEVHIQGGGVKTLTSQLNMIGNNGVLEFLSGTGFGPNNAPIRNSAGGVLATKIDNANNFGVNLGSSARIYGEDENSYVLGILNSTRTVNSYSDFGGIGVDITAATTNNYMVVTRITGVINSGVGLKGASIQRSFQFLPSTATGLNFTLVFHYLTNELNSNDPNKLGVFTSPSSTASFTELGRTSNNVSAKTVSISQVKNSLLATFTLGETNVAPLPVTLVSFTAVPTPQGAALLRWLTASEMNNKGFGIERTLGIDDNWKEVGYVATTNTPNGKSYEYTDKSLITAPASTQAYYRLRQEDLDGTISYSPVAVVARQAVVVNTNIVLSPVPLDGPNLSVSFAEAGQAGQEVAIINTQGQRMLHFTTQNSAEGTLSLPVANLAAGVYIVRIQTPGQAVRHARFVKL
jgi:hypothetical protein